MAARRPGRQHLTRSGPSAWLGADHLDWICAAFLNTSGGVRCAYCHVVATYDMQTQYWAPLCFDFGEHGLVGFDVFRSGVDGLYPIEAGL